MGVVAPGEKIHNTKKSRKTNSANAMLPAHLLRQYTILLCKNFLSLTIPTFYTSLLDYINDMTEQHHFNQTAKLVSKFKTEYDRTQFLVRILHYWPEDDPLRSIYVPKLRISPY